MAGRPKKPASEKWTQWERNHFTRTFSARLEASVHVAMEQGKYTGQLRMSIILPIVSCAHGKALAQELHEMIERDAADWIEGAKPSKVRARKRDMRNGSDRSTRDAASRPVPSIASPLSASPLSKTAATRELIGFRVDPAPLTQTRRA